MLPTGNMLISLKTNYAAIVEKLTYTVLMGIAEGPKRDFACPGCGAETIAGVVVGRSPGVKFKPQYQFSSATTLFACVQRARLGCGVCLVE